MNDDTTFKSILHAYTVSFESKSCSRRIVYMLDTTGINSVELNHVFWKKA
jgi:hypothetical protein